MSIITNMVKQMQINLSKKNSERVLYGAKQIANLGQDYFASLNNNSIKSTSSIRSLIEAFLLIPIILPTAITVAWLACTYFLLNAVNIQKNDFILSKIAKFTAKVFIYIAAAIILIPCIILNIATSLVPALILYCISRCFPYQKNISIEKQTREVSAEEYKIRIEQEVDKLEEQNAIEPTTEVISQAVQGGTDRTVIVGITNDDIKDVKGVIRVVEDDHNVAIKGIITSGKTEGYATGFGIQCSLIKEDVIDFQFSLSKRIGSNRKQAVDNLKQSDSVRTLLFGDNGILSVEQLGSSQQK